MNRSDADRLELLDRIEKRVPELRLDQQSVERQTLDEATRPCSSTVAGWTAAPGAYFANCGDDLHAVGSLAPLIPGASAASSSSRMAAAALRTSSRTRWRADASAHAAELRARRLRRLADRAAADHLAAMSLRVADLVARRRRDAVREVRPTTAEARGAAALGFTPAVLLASVASTVALASLGTVSAVIGGLIWAYDGRFEFGSAGFAFLVAAAFYALAFGWKL